MSQPLLPVEFRILVTGWRDWPRQAEKVVHWALDTVLHKHAPRNTPVIVIDGQCPYGGVDDFAHEWALMNDYFGVRPERYPARVVNGKILGPERNALMVSKGANWCLGFPGPNSRGTRDCLNKARAAGIRDWVIPWRDTYLQRTLTYAEFVDSTRMSPYS